MQDPKTYTPKHIEISDGLLEFLTPAKADNAYSRCDAFYDLAVRASSSAGPVSYMGYDFDLRPGEFIITMTDLAKLWGWHRRTVRYFIENLQSLGILHVTTYRKFHQVDMIALRFNTTEDPNPDSSVKTHDLQTKVPQAEGQNVPHVSHANVPLDTNNYPGGLCGTFCQKFDFNPADTRFYSAGQRKYVASMALGAVFPSYFTALESLYTPRVEKILLDTFYKRCKGNVDDFSEIIGNFAEYFSAGLHVTGIIAAVESLAGASEIVPDASKAPGTVDSTTKPPKAKRTRKTKTKL